jgi:hypothetical protein
MVAALLCAPLAMGQSPAPAAADAQRSADSALAAIREDTLRQQSRLMFELGAWGEASLIGSGLAFLAARGPFARGFELQVAVWGLGDAAVAAVNLLRLRKDGSRPGGIEAWTRLRQQAQRDHRVDALIDFLLLAFAAVAWRLFRAARWRGMAAGIALQCGFLVLFNLLATLV